MRPEVREIIRNARFCDLQEIVMQEVGAQLIGVDEDGDVRIESGADYGFEDLDADELFRVVTRLQSRA